MFVLALSTMMSLFICMLVGYMAAKIEFITKDMLPTFNKLLINITFPAMMLSVLNVKLPSEILKIMPEAIILGFLYNFILWGMAVLLIKIFRVKKHIRSILTFCFIFTNVGFIGFPLIDSVFPSDAMLYLTFINISYNILMFSLGVWILEEDESNKVSIKQILTTPVMISIWIGLFLLLSQLFIPKTFTSDLGTTRLPYFLSYSISMIGSITSPLAMLIVGVSLVDTNLKKVFLDIKLHIFSFLRLIVAPIVVYFIFKPFVHNDMLLGVTALLAGLPSATFVVILAQEYKLDYVFASEVVFITTLYSIITIPILFLIFA